MALITPLASSAPLSKLFISEVQIRAKDLGFHGILWQANTSDQATALLEQNFVERDSLHLLIRNTQGPIPTPFPLPGELESRRVGSHQIEELLALDALSFEPFWQLDERSLEEALLATPRHRFRVIVDRSSGKDNQIAGYSIFGLGGGFGFLQRIAVAPEYRGSGIAKHMTLDGLRWIKRWRGFSVSVNTQTSNKAALGLYLALEFHLQNQSLLILEHPLDS